MKALQGFNNSKRIIYGEWSGRIRDDRRRVGGVTAERWSVIDRCCECGSPQSEGAGEPFVAQVGRAFLRAPVSGHNRLHVNQTNQNAQTILLPLALTNARHQSSRMGLCCFVARFPFALEGRG